MENQAKKWENDNIDVLKVTKSDKMFCFSSIISIFCSISFLSSASEFPETADELVELELLMTDSWHRFK